MRLHILPQEKIIFRTIEIFEEVFPNSNKYIILSNKNSTEKVSKDIQYCKYGKKSFWKAVGDIAQYQEVIVHYLSYESAKFVNSITHNNITWIEWGGDLYNSLLAKRGFKLYRDESVVNKCKSSQQSFIARCMSKYITQKMYKCIYDSIFKVKNFVPDSMYDEYPLLLSYYPEFRHLKYKEFFYYPIDYMLGRDDAEVDTKTQNIIVGNSCSFTNNHTYVMNLLKDRGINNDVFMPLSYGGNRTYQKLLIDEGYRLFGDHFHPIINFMPLEQYNKLILSTKIFIYGNLRQEAVGNVLMALYIGGKVFLDEKNPLYGFYVRQNLIVHKLQDVSRETISQGLSKEEKSHNKRIIELLYSKARMIKIIQNSFGDGCR